MINSKQILKISLWVQKSYLHFMPEKVKHSEIISQEACDSPLSSQCLDPPVKQLDSFQRTSFENGHGNTVMFGILLCIAFYMFYSPIPVKAADNNFFTCLNP